MRNKLWIILVCCLFTSTCSMIQGDKGLGGNQNTESPIAGTGGSVNSDKNKQVQILSTADVLSVALTLKRQGKQSQAEASDLFGEKDGVRLNVSMVKKGYLLVLYKGSDGDQQIIFPNKGFYYGRNEVEPNTNIVIPSEGWFFFDQKKGTETIFIIFYETKDQLGSEPDAKRLIQNLEKTQAEKNNAEAFITENGSFVRIIKLSHQ